MATPNQQYHIENKMTSVEKCTLNCEHNLKNLSLVLITDENQIKCKNKRENSLLIKPKPKFLSENTIEQIQIKLNEVSLESLLHEADVKNHAVSAMTAKNLPCIIKKQKKNRFHFMFRIKR